MAMKKEALTNLIADDLAKRNDNWTEIDNTFALKADKLLATNVATNGDFSQGTIGWYAGGQGTTISVVDGEMNILSTSNGGTVRRDVSVTANNKYYLKAKVKTTSGLVYMAMYDGAEILMGPNVPKTGEYITFSHIFDITRTSTKGQIQPVRDGRNSGYDTIYLDNVVFINLTQTFGIGNEPTKEQMDRLLSEFPNSWFNGTQELLPLKILPDVFAMKQQEAWITATLLNGTTAFDSTGNPIGYYKDSVGIVRIRGLIKPAQNSIVIQLPIGYRPSVSVYPMIRDGSGASKSCYIGTTGGLYIYGANYTSYISLDSITFRAEQ